MVGVTVLKAISFVGTNVENGVITFVNGALVGDLDLGIIIARLRTRSYLLPVL